jgi:hypothetical protein
MERQSNETWNGRRMSLADALAPLQRAMAGHDMSDEETLALFEAARLEARSERRQRKDGQLELIDDDDPGEAQR